MIVIVVVVELHQVFRDHLQKVRPDLLVRAVPGQLLGQHRDPLGGVSQGLGTRDQLPLGSLTAADQLRQVRHQVGYLLGCRD